MATALLGDHRVTDASHDDDVARFNGLLAPPLFRFSNRSAMLTMPLQATEVGSCFQPMPRRLFDAVVVDGAFPLYRSAITLDLLAGLHNSLTAGGVLHLSRRSCEPAASAVRLPIAELDALFDHVEHRDDGTILIARAPEDVACDRSVLAAFWALRGELILDEVLGGSVWGAEAGYAAGYLDGLVLTGGASATRRLRPQRADLVAAVEHVRDPAAAGRPYEGPMRFYETPWKFTESAGMLEQRIASWLRYRMWGAYYKAPFFRAVLRRLLGDDRPIDLVEHGGDVGLVPLQLLLEEPPMVRTVINVEANSSVALAGKRLVEHFGDALDRRYRYALTTAEDFEYPGDCDAVSFTQSLLYVRRDLAERTLRTAFERLRPGGVLMVFENTMPPMSSASNDADIAFSPQELDLLLGTVGPVQHFRVKDAAPCSADESATIQVLRVVTRD
jgi:hypothetical protein